MSMPRREDFATHDAYLLAWYTWRALRRDAELTDEERAVVLGIAEEHVHSRMGQPGGREGDGAGRLPVR